jgi:hypothetical protein
MKIALALMLFALPALAQELPPPPPSLVPTNVVSPSELLKMKDRLERKRPGVAAPIILSAISGALFPLGFVSIGNGLQLNQLNLDGTLQYTVGVGSLVLGVAGLVLSGIWGYARVTQRSEIDQEIGALDAQLKRATALP